MFSKILVAIDTPEESQAALDLVRQVATEGLTKVQVLHLRERELSGSAWYSREGGDEASYVAESAVFELRMSGVVAGGNVRHAIVDRVAEAILREAEAFEADLVVLGRPRRGELATRLPVPSPRHAVGPPVGQNLGGESGPHRGGAGRWQRSTTRQHSPTWSGWW